MVRRENGTVLDVGALRRALGSPPSAMFQGRACGAPRLDAASFYVVGKLEVCAFCGIARSAHHERPIKHGEE